MTFRRRSVLVGVGGALTAFGGCLGRGESAPPASRGELTVAVTTSTYDSGLLDELHAAFEADYGVAVRAISAGTGETIAAGRRGDVDVVMAHARPLEDAFLDSGHGINRRRFADGDFVVAGPPADPADVAGAETAAEAFERIAEADAPFLSRGDNSGTHLAEREVWEAVGTEPTGEWYHESGQGMGATLIQADQQGSYLLTVRGNLLSMDSRLSLDVYVEGPVTGGDPLLDNPYSVMAVNPARHEAVAYELALLYIGFLTGRRGQSIIENYTVGGRQLFFPSGLSAEPDFEQYQPRNSSA